MQEMYGKESGQAGPETGGETEIDGGEDEAREAVL
jgi:hypothetical protein